MSQTVVQEANSSGDPTPTVQGTSGGPKPAAQITSRHRLSSSERSNTLTDEKVTVISCPKVNCPERIVSMAF